MAMYPCSFCGQRYHGKQNTAYAAVLFGDHRLGRTLRLCSTHFDELVESTFLRSAEEQTDFHAACDYCGIDGANSAVFVTTYRAGQGREDYYGRLCEGCASDDVRDALKIPPHEPQPVLGPEKV